MPRMLIVWVGLVCALASVTYRADAHNLYGYPPQQTNDKGSIHVDVLTDDSVADAIGLDAYIDGQTYPVDITDSDPAFTTAALPPGSYTLKYYLRGDASPQGRYKPASDLYGFYDRTTRASEATTITVTAGMTTTIDLDLTNLGSISGDVTVEETGQWVDNYSSVAAFNEDGELVMGGDTYEGRYAVNYLPPGTYTVKFSGWVTNYTLICNPKPCEYEPDYQAYEEQTLPPSVVGEGEHATYDVKLGLLSAFDNLTYLPIVTR